MAISNYVLLVLLPWSTASTAVQFISFSQPYIAFHNIPIYYQGLQSCVQLLLAMFARQMGKSVFYISITPSGRAIGVVWIPRRRASWWQEGHEAHVVKAAEMKGSLQWGYSNPDRTIKSSVLKASRQTHRVSDAMGRFQKGC